MLPDVHAFPASDTDFRIYVRKVLEDVARNARNARVDLGEVEDLVRRRYRNVQIVAREESSSYDLVPAWYAYRDGRVRVDDPRRERLYESLTKARDVVGQAGDALEHSRAAARAAGYR